MLDSFDNQKLRQMLVVPGFLTEVEFKEVSEEALSSSKDIAQVILEKNYLSATELSRLVADAIDIPYVELSKIDIPPDVLAEIPELVARENQAVAFGRGPDGLKVAFADPLDKEKIEHINKKLDHKVIVVAASPQDVLNVIEGYPSDYLIRFKKLIKDAEDDAKHNRVDETLVELLDTFITYALRNKASDIHIEPYEDRVLVRYRIDGSLHHIVDMPKSISESIISRVKVMARLRLDEHMSSQDGKIRFKFGQEHVDIRVSIAPIIFGEKVVMRLLSDKNRSLNLTDLGLTKERLKKLDIASSRKQGMILSCGPTGSGKTTTLYAVVKKVNSIHVNIATIEDPVEYDIEGINQIQVNSLTNLTFAKGLRTILRQDPDIIMVGEIRDIETAGIATNAAMTGHLVLSSLHTNDAATAIPRLLDMDIEPFVLATCLNLVVGQRLVRRICNSCRVSYNLSEHEAEIIAAELKLSPDKIKRRLYKGKGCSVCGDTGYRGRIGIFELLVVSDQIKQLIVEKADANEIKRLAIKEGMNTMMDDGLIKVNAGVTTIDEILSEVNF